MIRGRRHPFWTACVCLLTFVPHLGEARVVRFVVEQQRPITAAAASGSAGDYERLDGTAYFELDPRDPLNAVIVNLDKASRNVRGQVEFSAPFLILKPVDMARGNHKIFYGVNNRGNLIERQGRSFPPIARTNDPLSASDIGDNILLTLGYTVVDAGWQGNVIASSDQLVPTLPVATQPDGSAIVGRVRLEYVGATGFTRSVVVLGGFRGYEAAETDTTHSTLTVRDRMIGGSRTAIAGDRWAFGRCVNGRTSLSPSTTDICLFDGFQPEKIYELIYPATSPMVMGLGYAVTRDLASFLRYETRDDLGNPNPLAASATDVGIRRAYGSGTSSTAMYMRDWLYLGFNEDGSHRQVFDAVHIHTPGAFRLLANVEFSDPNVWAAPDRHHDFLSNSVAPTTFAVTVDPITGRRDGILKRPATDPLVFQTDSANEFWTMDASLNVANGLGAPVRIPETVRLYFLSSASHIGIAGLFTPAGAAGNCQNPRHDPRYLGGAPAPTIRALLVALDAWADQRTEPPPSNYPRLEDGTLGSRDDAEKAFPKVPGVQFPQLPARQVLNFGSGLTPQGGRLTLLPPTLGAPYALFVPQPDRDGLDVAGVRPMEVRAPLGTNMGWNLHAAGPRHGEICGVHGSWLPFARTKAERLESGDPRLSLEERYGDHAGFVGAVEKAANELVKERFLLEEDADKYVRQAEASDVLR